MAGEANLLQAWNPMTEPLAVKIHADALLRSPAPRHVWFGRIYVGESPGALSEQGAREKWPHVARLADRLEATSRELVLFITNFQSLHALRIDRILFGNDAARAPDFNVPSYYRDRPVSIWFRVRDIRPLSHDQMATFTWLQDNLRVPQAREGRTFEAEFDPFRSFKYGYPVEVRTLPASEVFDYGRMAATQGRQGLFAEQPGTVFPPNLELAFKTLSAEMNPPWALLDEQSRVFLASTRLVEALQQPAEGVRYGFEPSAALILLAKAVEWECRQFLLELQSVTRASPRWRTWANLSSMTLGDVGHVFREMRQDVQVVRFPRTGNILRNDEWLAWLEEFNRARNRAAHAECLSQADYGRHRDLIFVRGGSRFTPLCEAKKEIRNVRAS